MVSGGFRAGAGRPKNLFGGVGEDSGLVELPKVFRGYVPKFPLPPAGDGSEEREAEVWKRLWKHPQAAMWSREKWRQDAVALYTRLSVRVEGSESKAADINAMLRLREEIGLTPQGMRMNGWMVAEDEVSEKRAERSSVEPPMGFQVIRGG